MSGLSRDLTREREDGAFSADLVEAFRRREEHALERFFDAYYDRVFDLEWRLAGDVSVAEDLAQEVMLKLHRAAPTLEPDRDPWRWVVTIALNTFRDHWTSSASRQRRRDHALDDEGGHAPPTAATPDPSEQSASRERARLVQEALEEMPPKVRAVVVLHDYEGMSHADIAEALDEAPATIRKRYSRGLSLLGELLRERGL